MERGIDESTASAKASEAASGTSAARPTRASFRRRFEVGDITGSSGAYHGDRAKVHGSSWALGKRGEAGDR
jgi:hypothetical protein